MSDPESGKDEVSQAVLPGRLMAHVTRTWTNTSEHLFKSVTEANRAALAAFGVNGDTDTAETSTIPSLSYSRPGWSFERSVENVDEITAGDTVRFSKLITDADVEAFAGATGDTNRLHLDESFADDTRFGGRIVHGVLVLGLISAALARLPGLTIYLSQDVQFTSPAEIGERYTAVVEVTEQIDDRRYRLKTDVVDDEEQTVVDGEAVVLVDDVPE